MVILKLGVEASVEKVGVDNQGRMDVPKSFYNVGWYKYGARPGEKGNAVIAGHYDTVTGTDAVFFNLSKLEVGDELKVIDESGAEHDYKVSQINTYLFNQVPLNYVFGNTDKSRLNLITCSGVFDRNTRNYSHRTIVYSDLISSSYPNP